jgi:hypothetical protein
MGRTGNEFTVCVLEVQDGVRGGQCDPFALSVLQKSIRRLFKLRRMVGG